MEANNAISQALDETIPSVMADEKRPTGGFVTFARYSHEFERYQRMALSNYITDGSTDLPSKLFFYIAQAMQLGFEAGKNYALNGGVERILKMEDDWNRAHPPQG